MKNTPHHSSSNTNTVIVSMAAIFTEVLKSYQLDHRPIFAEAGLDPYVEQLISKRIPIDKMKKLWDLACQYTQDPCLGLTYASYIQPSALHGVGFSWLASHTLIDGIKRLIRFQKIVGPALNFTLNELSHSYQIQTYQKRDIKQFPDAAYDARFAAFFRISKMMMGPDLRPVKVSFEHDRPMCSEKFDHFFGIPVLFNADSTAIEFDKKICEVPTSSSNPELARINDQIVIDYLHQFEETDLVTRTRQMIIDELPSGNPEQKIIAQDLNLSLRNFQRKLSDENTSFNELLNSIRHELALKYLSNPQYQIIEISYLLGFSDPSNFSRAFKRWHDITPVQYQQEK